MPNKEITPLIRKILASVVVLVLVPSFAEAQPPLYQPTVTAPNAGPHKYNNVPMDTTVRSNTNNSAQTVYSIRAVLCYNISGFPPTALNMYQYSNYTTINGSPQYGATDCRIWGTLNMIQPYSGSFVIRYQGFAYSGSPTPLVTWYSPAFTVTP